MEHILSSSSPIRKHEVDTFAVSLFAYCASDFYRSLHNCCARHIVEVIEMGNVLTRQDKGVPFKRKDDQQIGVLPNNVARRISAGDLAENTSHEETVHFARCIASSILAKESDHR